MTKDLQALFAVAYIAHVRGRVARSSFFGEHGIVGERMQGDEVPFKEMTGPLWDELEPIPGSA
ncbi:hypothetical protein [Nocardioides alcanivorans]|uniref:hypothetical protein n=1 Tax=Nocardioides alcanivorans TaxID=2897352 RepID=UPI001F3B2D1F|nr:hypothetical protein [Nocardioides alcanivorans]